MEDSAAVDVSTVGLTAHFPDLEAFPGEFAALATLLSPEGIRVELALPGDEVRVVHTAGRDLVWCYARLGQRGPLPWCLGGGLAETDGERVRAPGSPPLVGSVADWRRTLGGVVADLFVGLADAGADPVLAVERCLGPGVDVDVAAVRDRVLGRG